MRAIKELITELEENAKGHNSTALIIGFESSTIFVKADDPNRLQLLEQAIAFGGEPVGWYRLKAGELEMGVLQDYSDEEWVHEYLKALRDGVEAAIKEVGA